MIDVKWIFKIEGGVGGKSHVSRGFLPLTLGDGCSSKRIALDFFAGVSLQS
jgi:hypothetical protein